MASLATGNSKVWTLLLRKGNGPGSINRPEETTFLCVHRFHRNTPQESGGWLQSRLWFASGRLACRASVRGLQHIGTDCRIDWRPIETKGSSFLARDYYQRAARFCDLLDNTAATRNVLTKKGESWVAQANACIGNRAEGTLQRQVILRAGLSACARRRPAQLASKLSIRL